jgi:hypothetical protein
MAKQVNNTKSITGVRKIILALYSMWERLYYRICKVQVENDDDLLYIRPMIYKGHPIELDDGLVIEKGDRVLQLHFNNRLLIETAVHSTNTMQMITLLLRMMRNTLKRLGEKISSDSYTSYKGLYGISLMHRGATQFGFTVIEMPKGFDRSYQHFYLRMLMAIMHPDGRVRLKQKTDLLTPKIVAVSRSHFLNSVSKKESS